MSAIRNLIRRSDGLYRRYRLIRTWWLRKRRGLRHVHPTAFFAGRSAVAADLVTREEVFIGAGCSICPRVKLGRYVMFGPEVTITGSDHRFDVAGTPMIFAGRPPLHETVIEDDVWVGHRAIIMAGVRIGRGSIVAAQSVVTRDIPPYEIHGGIPARRIRARFESAEQIARHQAMLDGPVVPYDYCRPLDETPPG